MTGPTAAKPREEILDKANISVNFTPVSGQGGTLDRLYEGIIQKTANALIITALYPRTVIKINCQVLCDDGSILSTCLNAMNVALLDCGVPMKSTCSGVTCMIHKDGRMLLDPTSLELEDNQSIHTFVFESASGNCLAMHSTGIFTKQEVSFFNAV